MAKNKSAAELAEDVRKLEERLKAAKEKEKQKSKAEEAKHNAAIIKTVREYWAALPEKDRPKWEEMPDYIRDILYHEDETDQEEEQPHQERKPWQLPS